MGQQQGVVTAVEPVFDSGAVGELINDGEELVELLFILANLVDQPLTDGFMAHGEPGAIRVAAKFIIHSTVQIGGMGHHGQAGASTQFLLHGGAHIG